MRGATVTKLVPARKNRIETILLTPELATKLLEGNRLNRPLRDLHVKRIAAQIASGKWKFNGDTIKVADDGDVLDGQHRLWAVIEANRAIETIVVYGIERDAFATIDTLRQTRTGGDVIALAGAERHRNTIAMAIAWLIRWQRGIEKFKEPRNRVENADIAATFEAHPRIVEAVERAARLRGICNTALLAFFYYLITSRDADLGERMLDTLRDPTKVPLSDPFYRLRVYLIGEREKRKETLVTLALMVKATNAAKRGQKVQALHWRSQGKGAEAFPALEV